MRTQKEIADSVAGRRYVANRTVTEHTRVIVYDAVTKALERYRIALLDEFSKAILESLAQIEESTAADGMDEVFQARDDAGDLLQRIHDVIVGVTAHD